MKEVPKLTATSSLGRPSRTYRSQRSGWPASSQGTQPGLVLPSQLEGFEGLDVGDETTFADETGAVEGAEDLEVTEGLDVGDEDEITDEIDEGESFDES